MSRTKHNHFKPPMIKKCDECGQEPANGILWQEKYRHLWCVNCWPYDIPNRHLYKINELLKNN